VFPFPFPLSPILLLRRGSCRGQPDKRIHVLFSFFLFPPCLPGRLGQPTQKTNNTRQPSLFFPFPLFLWSLLMFYKIPPLDACRGDIKRGKCYFSLPFLPPPYLLDIIMGEEKTCRLMFSFPPFFPPTLLPPSCRVQKDEEGEEGRELAFPPFFHLLTQGRRRQ